MCYISVAFFTLNNTLYNRLLGKQYDRSEGMAIDTYRGPQPVGVRDISIGVLRKNRIRTVTTIAYCATDIPVNVSIDRYLEYQQFENNTKQAIIQAIP